MDFRLVADLVPAIPEGRYRVHIEKAEAANAKTSGVSMISLMLSVVEGPFVGFKLYDNLITDPGNGGARFARKKLKGLAPQLLELSIPDEIAAEQHLLDLTVLVDVGQKGKFEQDPTTKKWDVPVTEVTEDGRTVKVMQNEIKSYYRVQAPAAVPQVQSAPQGVQYQQAPQGYAPQGGATPQQAAAFQQQFAPQMQYQGAGIQPQVQAQAVPIQAQPQIQYAQPGSYAGPPAGAEVMPGFTAGPTGPIGPSGAVQGLPQSAQMSSWMTAQAPGQAPAVEANGAGAVAPKAVKGKK